MSKTKTTYILRSNHLIRYRNEGKDKCERCRVDFSENDIVASTTKRKLYCYACAAKIKLVTGNPDKDLNYDVLFPNSIDLVCDILKKIHADEETTQLSLEIIHTLYRERKLFTKNISGLAAGAIFLAYKLQKQDFPKLVCSITGIELQNIKRGSSMILKSLADTPITYMSESILSVKTT